MQRSHVPEALLAVDHAVEVQPEARIADQRLDAPLAQHDRERRRRDDIRVTGRARRLGIEVYGIVGADRDRELTDLLAPHQVWRRRRVGLTGVRRVQRHPAAD